MYIIQRSFASVAVAAAISLLHGCASSQKNIHDTTWDGWQSVFEVPAGEWSSHGSNSYFILEPGHTMEYADPSGSERLTITVTKETQLVDGVETRVVVESETVGGQPKEISRNFFAISKKTNNVYYFGEEVDMYRNGQVTSHEGGWRSGVGGAKFGLFMPGKIDLGARFYQEHAPGLAMDRYEIKSIDQSLDTPAGRFEKCLQVEETTPLEPGIKEYKLYAPGVGLIQDGDLLLTSSSKAANPSAGTKK